ncbi:hypothetical protein COCNU_07G014530 [Cocos nucifera]|uniref:Uncharacterized protein n=1 Tax=Cocos nucifera TaxID=13894 RepID=A0A8K0N5M7_COCNU|nr:hypothetical protein COCNU_07G014530 [Cocos nucifera]
MEPCSAIPTLVTIILEVEVVLPVPSSLVEDAILVPPVEKKKEVEKMMKSTVKKLGHHLFANIEAVNIHEAEASKAAKEADVAKVEAQESKAEVEHLKEALKEKSTEVEHLKEALRKVEQTLVEIKNTLEINLASKIERRKKAEVEASKGEKRAAEAKKQAMAKFKALKELEDIKIKFTKEAFNKGFKIYQ